MLSLTHGYILTPTSAPLLIVAQVTAQNVPSTTMGEQRARVRLGCLHPMVGLVLFLLSFCLTGSDALLQHPTTRVVGTPQQLDRGDLDLDPLATRHVTSAMTRERSGDQARGAAPSVRQGLESLDILNMRNVHSPGSVASRSRTSGDIGVNEQVNNNVELESKLKGEYGWMGFPEKMKLSDGEYKKLLELRNSLDNGKGLDDLSDNDRGDSFLDTGIESGIHQSKMNTVLNVNRNIRSGVLSQDKDASEKLLTGGERGAGGAPPGRVDVTQLLSGKTPTDDPKGGKASDVTDIPHNIVLSLQNDTDSLRALIQKTVEKILDSLESQLLLHEEQSPQTFEAESDYLSNLDSPESPEDASSTNELEEMLKNERVSELQQKIEASYEHVLSVLLEATASQTVPENLDFWQKVSEILEESTYLSRTRRSYNKQRRGYRRRLRMRRFRMRMRTYIRRQLAINYGHVSPCGYHDRYYCMNGGTCVIIGDLDIKTCRCPIGFTNTRCQQIDQEYILSLLNTSLVFS